MDFTLISRVFVVFRKNGVVVEKHGWALYTSLGGILQILKQALSSLQS